MSQSNDSTARRAGSLGVHSVNRFVFSVPDLEVAARFYAAFGLDVRRSGDRLDLHTFGSPHRWGTVVQQGEVKRLQYLSFGIFAADLPAFEDRIAGTERIAPHPLSDGDGLWFKDPEGTAIQLVVAPKMSPSAKTQHLPLPVIAPGRGAAPNRKTVTPVRPRYLSHLLIFARDVDAQVDFYQRVLGLRLSDTSKGIVAFLHGPHASDHHLLALAKSHATGLHHTSWDVGSVHEIGLGSEQMRAAGYAKGWGVGRHVLGSNYFYYVRDPWGSYAEYSFDIDFVPVDLDWPAANHPPEDSLYVWGPEVPADFVTNYEVPEVRDVRDVQQAAQAAR